jgi:hypothetical protein
MRWSGICFSVGWLAGLAGRRALGRRAVASAATGLPVSWLDGTYRHGAVVTLDTKTYDVPIGASDEHGDFPATGGSLAAHDFDRSDHMTDEHHSAHDVGAYQTLQKIQAGGHHLLTITRRRLVGVLDELDNGDFRQAYSNMQEAMGPMGALANAQTFMGVADGAVLIDAANLKVGMVLRDVGEIGDVTITQCAATRCSGHVHLKIGEHEVDYVGDAELYVECASLPDDPAPNAPPADWS